MKTEVIINKNTDGLSQNGFEILKTNVEKINKLLISKATDSIVKNRKAIADIARPVNCEEKIYYIRFTISMRKDGVTPISYRIMDSNETSVISFEDTFSKMDELKEVVQYVNDNLGKIL